MEEELDFEQMSKDVIAQIRSGRSLFGKDGAFAPLLEKILNAALEGEMDAHLTREERELGNRRNGKMSKQVQTPMGEVTVTTPRALNVKPLAQLDTVQITDPLECLTVLFVFPINVNLVLLS